LATAPAHIWLDAELKSPDLHPANEEDRQKAGRFEEQGGMRR
jgi:hypothetical protein